MSKKDAKSSYAILTVIALAAIAVAAVLYNDRVAKQAEMAAKSVRTGVVPSGARSAPRAQAARTAAEQAADMNLSRTVKVQRHRSVPSGGTLRATRAATTEAVQTAKSAGGQTSGVNPMRSASVQKTQGANPAASPVSASNRARSAPQQAQAANPRAGNGSGASAMRGAGAQETQAAKPGGRASAPSLARSAPKQAAQSAPAGRDKLAMNRSLPSEANKAVQAPIALQRKWDPARSLQASPDQDPQTQDPQTQEL